MASYVGIMITPGVLLGRAGNMSFKGVMVPMALDGIPPTASLVAPSTSVPLQVDSAVTVRARDERGIVRVFLWVEYADTSSEVIYRDGSFLPAFQALSTATVLDALSMEFVISRGIDVNGSRVGGWPSSPRIYVGAIDSGGNVS